MSLILSVHLEYQKYVVKTGALFRPSPHEFILQRFGCQISQRRTARSSESAKTRKFFYLFAHAQTKVTLARQPCFHWIMKDGVVNEIGKNQNDLILPTPILSSL